MIRHITMVSLLALAVAGCATMPSGPSVLVLPAPGKPFEQFLGEDAACRRWAEGSIGLAPQQAYEQSVTGSAALGTVVGAGVGALLGAASGHAGTGAAIGAGSGLLLGSASGSDAGEYSGRQAQRRYDNTYLQCMYAYGNQVPGTVRRNYRSTPVGARPLDAVPQSALPPGATPPPPGFDEVPPDYTPEAAPAGPPR